MRPPTRTFTPAFQQGAVRLLETSGKGGMALAKDLGLSDGVRYRWCEEQRANGQIAFPSKGQQMDLAAEVRPLQRENGRLQQERDILKQAAAILGRVCGEICLHCPKPGGIYRASYVASCLSGYLSPIAFEKLRV